MNDEKVLDADAAQAELSWHLMTKGRADVVVIKLIGQHAVTEGSSDYYFLFEVAEHGRWRVFLDSRFEEVE